MAQRTVALCDGKFIGIESIYTVIDGKQINIPDKLEQLRAKSRNNELFCPCGCGANLVLVAGERNLREQHFRIKEGFDGICQMPVEGINSIDSKIALKCWLEDKLHTDDIESRVPIRTVSESERKYEFTFMSAKKKVALSFCNEYRNLSDDKFTILEQHSNGNSIIYVASGDKSETNGQYPEGLMKIQKRQGYCLLLNVDGADYSKAELTVVYYEKNADGVWEKVNIARDKLSKFDISDSSQIMYHNHSLSDMLKEKQLEFNKHKQAIIYQRELDKIHAEEAWRAEEERRKQARIKAEKDRKAELERREKERIEQEKIAAEKKEQARMEQERVEVEKRQKRQEFLKVINSGDCSEDRVLTDEGGRRWVQCEFCGKFAPASAFASYGGFGKLNKGKCYECSRNPNINTEVNVSEEKARQKQRYDPNICPECGGRLRLIQGPFGKFMGCENYPTCKFNRRVRKNRNVRVRTVRIVLCRGKIKCLIQMYKLKKYIKEYHFSQLIGTLYNREITLNL